MNIKTLLSETGVVKKTVSYCALVLMVKFQVMEINFIYKIVYRFIFF